MEKAQIPEIIKGPARVAGLEVDEDFVQKAADDAATEDAQPLLEQLVNHRLLISHDEEGHRMLEVAHEALLRKWPLLKGWLDEDREFLIGKAQLEKDHQDWTNATEQERPGALLSGLKLQRAKAWLAERRRFNDNVRDFVQASIDQADAQERKERQNRHRVMAGLSGLTALAVAGGGIAWLQKMAADAAQIDQYEANHRALLTSNPLESVVNGLAAEDNLRSNPGAALQLSYTLEQAMLNNFERHCITTDQGRVLSLVALSNGELVSGGDDGTLKRWNKDGKLMATIASSQGAVSSLVALPDDHLASGGKDGSVKVWSKDGKPMGTITTGQGAVLSLVALPNGELASSGQDGSVKRWSIEAVAKRGCVDLQGHLVLRDPQTTPQRAARKTCHRLGVMQ